MRYLAFEDDQNFDWRRFNFEQHGAKLVGATRGREPLEMRMPSPAFRHGPSSRLAERLRQVHLLAAGYAFELNVR